MKSQVKRSCSLPECERVHFGRGYCQIHHYRWTKHGDPLKIGKPAPRKPAFASCTIEGCDKPSRKRTYCVRHYGRWKRLGDANYIMPPRRGHGETWTREQWVKVFNSRFQRTDSGCLEWAGHLNKHGYGRFVFDGKQWFTHRLAYVLGVGDIPNGLMVCHHCDNPPCGEIGHLFLGTAADNLADMRAKGRGVIPTSAVGEQHPRTSLTEDAVRGIRIAYAEGENQSAIARRLDISRTIVANICLRKTWKQVS